MKKEMKKRKKMMNLMKLRKKMMNLRILILKKEKVVKKIKKKKGSKECLLIDLRIKEDLENDLKNS